MRLLANENFPGLAITALRLHGHDVVWIREDSPGISDHDVLSRATAEGRILIKLDKDFSELVFRLGLNAFAFHPIHHRLLPKQRLLYWKVGRTGQDTSPLLMKTVCA